MKRKRNKAHSGGKLVAAIVIVLAIAVYGAVRALGWYTDNRRSNFLRDAVIYVADSTTVDEVYLQIVSKAGVRSPYSLSRMFRKKQVADYMQPGCYEIRKDYTSAYVARMLNNCWQTPARLVLSGMMRRPEHIASRISKQMMIDSAEVVAALKNPETLAPYGFTPATVFALFLPDTYEMYWTSTMKDVLACQKKAYDEFWSRDRVLKARRQGLTPLEVSTLASIVTSETNYEPEMPKIAGVYLNRLRKHMPLQADPTIAFCYDYKFKRILRSHLKVDSPYNTYVNRGLPPGPICVPTKAAIEAVLEPEGDYLYFCANSDLAGSHLFAKTYNEHVNNAKAFRKALDKRNASSLRGSAP